MEGYEISEATERSMKHYEDIEDQLEIMLDPADGAYDPPRNLAQRAANKVRAMVLAEPDEDFQTLMQDDLRTAIACVVYAGDDPKAVPNDIIKHALVYPPEGYNVFVHLDARKRVKNPNTAVRAFCLECQGNDSVGVRQCPSFNCPLHPFRMGGNPFFGRLVNSTGEEESNETQAEIDAMEAESEANTVQTEVTNNGNS
jgi:hypothetical protein